MLPPYTLEERIILGGERQHETYYIMKD